MVVDIGGGTTEISVLAFDEWQGAGIYPELLTSFVVPNHPALAQVISRAADFLGKWTGDPSFDAYQSQDVNRVLSQSAAIFEAMIPCFTSSTLGSARCSAGVT